MISISLFLATWLSKVWPSKVWPSKVLNKYKGSLIINFIINKNFTSLCVSVMHVHACVHVCMQYYQTKSAYCFYKTRSKLIKYAFPSFDYIAQEPRET